LARFFPEGVRAYWQELASFHLVVHHSRQSFRLSSLAVAHAAAKFINRLDPAVIHFDEGSRRMLLSLVELRGRPMVMTIHDPELHSGERRWRSDVYRRIFLSRASRVILYNRTFQTAFADRYGFPAHQIHTTRLGVHHIFREWSVGPVPHGGRTVLFYGRLSRYKGLETLYAAAPLVAERVPGVRFIVAGRPVAGYQPPPLPTLANGGRLELVDRYLGNREMADLLTRAHVVVCPYLDATQSGVVLTAFAFEKPLVATNVGGLPEYIDHGNTGLLVPPRNPTALAEALVQVLTNDDLVEHLRAGIARLGRDRLLDWSSTARDVREVYEDALSP
jgi:glycosyltransferase involved in cell wall biosynthesis